MDRAKAAQVLKALPAADHPQVVAMVDNPELFSQVARGNLSATERTQLLNKANDIAEQKTFPGMGGGGLFDTRYRPKDRRTARFWPDEINEWNGKRITTITEDQGIHVTGKPENFVKFLESGGDVSKGRNEGLVGDLGTSGLYYSNAPQLWTGRVPEKWETLYSISEENRNKLADALTEKVKQQRETKYITEPERDVALRDIGYYRQDGKPTWIVNLATQPYNIAFWKDEYLKPLGIEQPKMPKEVPIHIEGKLADVTNVHVGRVARVVRCFERFRL